MKIYEWNIGMAATIPSNQGYILMPWVIDEIIKDNPDCIVLTEFVISKGMDYYISELEKNKYHWFISATTKNNGILVALKEYSFDFKDTFDYNKTSIHTGNDVLLGCDLPDFYEIQVKWNDQPLSIIGIRIRVDITGKNTLYKKNQFQCKSIIQILDKIKINEEKVLIDEVEKTVYVIGMKNCETEVMWYPDNEKNGTYINLLPKYFLEYYQVFSKIKSEKKKVDLKKLKLSKVEKELIEEFKESCDGIIELYLFYKNTFLRRLTWEKNRGYHAVENVEIMITRKYDEEYVDTKLFETLPGVRDKIVNVLSDESEIQNIRERINTEQWLFQPQSRRGQVLEKIIGNGFKETDLTEDERELLCHFNQQGYKMLWRIMDLIEGPKVPTFEDLCEKLKEDRKELSVDEFSVLESLLKDGLKCYYEKNATNVEQVLYNHCIKQLRNVIGIYELSVDDISKLVVALYQQTKSKASKTKFFWNVFTWEELQCIVEDKGENEEWNKKLNSQFDFMVKQITYKNIIANALEIGPLQNQYFIVKRDPTLKDKSVKSNQRFKYLSDKSGRQEPSDMKIMKIIAAYLLHLKYHPEGQKEVWITNGELANWYGLDDGNNGTETFYPKNVFWKEKPIYTLHSLKGSYTKVVVDQEYLKEFDFKIIDIEDADKYKETHWVLEDLGHKLEGCWGIK